MFTSNDCTTAEPESLLQLANGITPFAQVVETRDFSSADFRFKSNLGLISGGLVQLHLQSMFKLDMRSCVCVCLCKNEMCLHALDSQWSYKHNIIIQSFKIHVFVQRITQLITFPHIACIKLILHQCQDWAHWSSNAI